MKKIFKIETILIAAVLAWLPVTIVAIITSHNNWQVIGALVNFIGLVGVTIFLISCQRRVVLVISALPFYGGAFLYIRFCTPTPASDLLLHAVFHDNATIVSILLQLMLAFGQTTVLLFLWGVLVFFPYLYISNNIK